ncbi:type II toxin-antitoxin system MqsA family antitoxin [Legionella israelensis]|uniref:Type II toxin-antitoxin system MqsA family antitoxin n=1 Tax=Legionella israelensis TaxID=454 RepID=A0AAX1EFE8_9GAMM|nr:type II toxin-antitoxin system MqsA family antitoxin [Legionella israelensis]QBR83819.1 type II toxin-antitoxin system MqsA family antitoxin [Legionella israelensis]
MNKEYCPICGEKALKHEIKPVPYNYKGHTFTIDQPAEWCSACGEGIIHPEDNKAVQARIQEEKARIDGLLTPQQIQKIRKFLKLNQKEASRLFGGGINAFNRYENGITPPPKPLSLLLTILEKHPNQLDELLEYADNFTHNRPLKRNHTTDRSHT